MYRCGYCNEIFDKANEELTENYIWQHKCFSKFRSNTSEIVKTTDKIILIKEVNRPTKVPRLEVNHDLNKHENAESLIESVRKQKCLWNTDIPFEERGPLQREKAWLEVSKDLDGNVQVMKN